MAEILFPYQIEGANFLAARRCALLADEMGLGKTAQAIRACDLVGAKRILVICPAVATKNWVREFTEFSHAPREFTILEKRLTDSKILADTGMSYICSYDIAPWIAPIVAGKFDALILDESHFLKSSGTKRTAAILGNAGLCRISKRIWALSGTPAPNNVAELWPILITFGCYTKTFEDFVGAFCMTKPLSRGGLSILGTKPGMDSAIRELLKPIMLRRRKEEVMKDLPAITFQHITVEPGPVQIELQQSYTKYFYPTNRVDELMDKLVNERAAIEAVVGVASAARTWQADDPAADIFAAVQSLAKSVSTLRRYVGLQKLDPVARMIADELDRGEYEKVVVFAVHVDVIEGLRERLSGNSMHHARGFRKNYYPVTLYGGTALGRRQKNVDRFQRDNHTRVFIGNIQAAGTAITLTRACNAIFLEQDWVPGNNNQAAMRIHRIGQTKPVTVRFVGLANSFDDRISNVLRRKAKDLQKIFDIEREKVLAKTISVSKTDTQGLNEIKQTSITGGDRCLTLR